MNKNSLKNLTYNHTPNSENKVRNIFKQSNLEIIDYTYKNTNTRMCCVDKDGYYIMASLTAVQKGVKQFQRFSVTSNESNFIRNANLYAKMNNITSRILKWKFSKIKNHVDVLCICECGNTFWCDFNSWRRLEKTRCNKCTQNMSNMAYQTKQWLESHNINFQIEYKFNDCIDKRPLPFDFYLNDKNICIEVDGEQHYGTDFFKNHVPTKNEFEKIKYHDKLKTIYCEKNNIKLIRLPYMSFHGNKYEKILEREIYN